MGTLNIQGLPPITVGPEFDRLSMEDKHKTVDEIAAKARANQPSVLKDVGVQSGVGLAEGGSQLAGLPGDAIQALRSGASWTGQKMGLPPINEADFPNKLLTSGAIEGEVQKATGKFPDPKTWEGSLARTVTPFVPAAAAGPGSLGRKAAFALIPGLGSAGAGAVAEQVAPEWTPAARSGGALLGLGTAMSRVPRMLKSSGNLLADALDANAQSKLTKLGPNAMMAEASPATEGLAQGIGSRGGEASNVLLRALEDRNRLANSRIRSDMNANIGPAVIPSKVEEILARQRKTVGGQYDTTVAQSTAKVNPSAVITNLDDTIQYAKGATKSKLQGVMEMLAPKGVMDTSPRGLHNTRQAIDDMMENAEPSLKAKLAEVRKGVDDEMARSITGVKNIDKAYSELKKQSAALETGGGVLGAGKTAIRPYDLEQQMSKMSRGEKAALVAGARGEIDRIIGTKANDVSAMKGLIQGEGDWNRSKLETLFGKNKAEKLFDAIERESVFQRTYNRIAEGSMTAQRRAGQEAVKRAVGDSPVIPAYERIMQLPEYAARKGVNWLTKGALDKRDVALAQMLASQGGPRAAVLQSMLARKPMQPVSFPPLAAGKSLLTGEEQSSNQ